MRRAALPLAVLSLTTVLGACGAKGGTATLAVSVDQVAAAGDALARQTSELDTITIKIRSDGKDVTLTGAGGYDNVAHRGQQTVMAGSLSIDEVFTTDTYYIKVPAGSTAGQGKAWVSLPFSTIYSASGQSSLQTDPADGLQALKGLTGVTVAGTEDIRGTRTTHYKGTVDLAQGLAKLSPELRQKTEGVFGSTGTVPVDIWLDADNLPRRYVSSVKGTTNGVDVSTKTTVEFYDFGTPLDVQLPAAADVRQLTSLSDLAGGLG